MEFLTKENIGPILLLLLEIYLVLTLILTIYDIIRMYSIEHKTNNVESGRDRVRSLIARGEYLQMPVYSNEEMEEDKTKEDVRLYYFPNDTGKTSKFVLICPGGGYAHICLREEGYPVAAALNKKGYNVFILEYRTRFNCAPYAPMEDVSRALLLIKDNQERFNVLMENYAIMGFSAGGNLAGFWGTSEQGYLKYHLPKPGIVILGYPWISVNDWMYHPYWNIWIGILGLWLSNRGSVYMFGFKNYRKNRHKLNLHRFIDQEYPKTYMFSGGWDILVPATRHSDVLEDAFVTHGVPYKYEKFFGLPHGIGIGQNSRAEGWLDTALNFWDTIV